MIEQIAVIGAGVMGHGIAFSCAAGGKKVKLYDLNKDILLKAERSIEHYLTLFAEESLIGSSDIGQIASRIAYTDQLKEAVEDVDLIIEAIPEVLEQKLAFYNRIGDWIKPDCIVASNTSSIPISQLSQCGIGPKRMIITHFFNPAHLVPLVEVIRHEATLPDTVDRTIAFLQALGKTPVVLKKDIPGFIANRLQAAMVREALYLIEQEVADIEDIDRVVTEGPGMRWAFIGPAATADFGGLDTWKYVLDHLSPELASTRQAPDIIRRLVLQGHLGTKTGKGIFTYSEGEAEHKIKERDKQFIKLIKVKKGDS